MLNHTSLRIMLCVLGLLAVGLAGCQIVHVKDSQGEPVAWADVYTSVQGQGESNFPAKTDFLGNATLMVSQEPAGTPEYIIVRKDGYIPGKIVRPESSSVDITLKSVPGGQSVPNAKTQK